MNKAVTKMEKNREKPKSDNSKSMGFKPIDWFWSNGNYSKGYTSQIKTEKTYQFMAMHWPFADDYSPPSNSFFLTGCPGPKVLEQQPYWFVRDGLIPLLWFFRINPVPGSFSSHLLVEEELSPFVPSAWRSKVGTYKVVAVERKVSRPQKLIISGGAGEDYCPWESLDEKLNTLKSIFTTEELDQCEKYCLIFEKTSSAEKMYKYFPEMYVRIFQKIGMKNFHFWNLNSLHVRESFDGFGFIDLNEKYLIADNYLLHAALKRGASVIDLKTKSNRNESPRGTFFRTSPFHGLYVCEHLTGNCVLESGDDDVEGAEKYLTLLDSVLRRNSFANNPWPQWFADWNKVLVAKFEKTT